MSRQYEKWHLTNRLPSIGRIVYILCKDRTAWLAYWNGEVWVNANSSDKIYINKEYVIAWHLKPRIPYAIEELIKEANK